MGLEFSVAVNGSQQGSCTLEQVARMLARGSLPPGSLCRYEGLAQWTPVEQVVPAAEAPAPLPPAASPVARTPGLEYAVERATRGLFSSWISGEGLVSTFRGTGTVLLAPVPNRFLTLIQEFGGLRALIHSIRKS